MRRADSTISPTGVAVHSTYLQHTTTCVRKKLLVSGLKVSVPHKLGKLLRERAPGVEWVARRQRFAVKGGHVCIVGID